MIQTVFLLLALVVNGVQADSGTYQNCQENPAKCVYQVNE